MITGRASRFQHRGFARVLGGVNSAGLAVLDKPTYFVERNDLVSRHHRNPISRWRVVLFSFMFRNSAHAIDRFKIPPNSLIEIGRRIEL
jgi:KUP system potassium uptake protein